MSGKGLKRSQEGKTSVLMIVSILKYFIIHQYFTGDPSRDNNWLKKKEKTEIFGN